MYQLFQVTEICFSWHDEHIKIRIPKTKKGVTEVEDYYPCRCI